MLDAIKKLLEEKVINEDMHDSIQTAWNKKLNESKDAVRVELREEFAQKYSHDRKVMVESLDKMISESLTTEIKEFKEEKASLASDRVKAQKKLAENARKFNRFMTAKLAEEIKDLRSDRKLQESGMNKMNGFIAKHLSEEIKEFATDKQDLVETKVKLVSEANKKFSAIKKKFVSESSKRVQKHVSKSLSNELTSLNEDIKAARENNFGRQIFEAFASEFTTTHLNENAVIRKLKGEIQHKDEKLNETFNVAKKYKKLTESKQKEIKMIKENNNRQDLMGELLRTLNNDKKEVMENLLENVQTNRLQNAFEKYLPAVLANKSSSKKPARRKQSLNENVRRTHTGNKSTKPKEQDDNIIDLVKLAGL